MTARWKFWIDVGGTFTDCLAESPEGVTHETKTLSSGRIKLAIDRWVGPNVVPLGSASKRDHFFDGVLANVLDRNGVTISDVVVTEAIGNQLTLDRSLSTDQQSAATQIELAPGEPAPLIAMRLIAGVPFTNPLPDCDVQLGTTRGTNALLTRTGSPTALVTTAGMSDLLNIGDQARPDLFALAIVKNEPLYVTAIGIDERVLADGMVEKAPNPALVRDQLKQLHDSGIEAVAISLMHGYRYSDHEKMVAEIARDVGFADVCLSSDVAPLIKIVPRSETTVLDAYLNSSIADYLDEIATGLSPNSTLSLMTSTGALTTREKFSGKDSVLSGPAGGVIGAANIGETCGFDRVIGFDMGGTSTDVSRYDGRFEREYESVKAGVRIMTPMLAVETVAAGGGSICRFDGTKLVVGPHSAGADPGPACYGRGGPLTVTDVNLFLGRIDETLFPFPLDRVAAERSLDELVIELAQQGHDYDSTKLANGFLSIANQSMASAIARISVSKGYDPREYALVSFGGAGSQHACAVAGLLEVRTILDPAQSSILSAVGIRAARPAAHSVISVLSPLDRITVDQLNNLVVDAVAAARNELSDLVTRNEEVCDRVTLDLRYLGTSDTLAIDWDGNSRALRRLKEAFQQLHYQRYGYRQNSALELVSVRGESAVTGGKIARVPRQDRERDPNPVSSQRLHVAGGSVDANIYHRHDLKCGDGVSGPALITSPLSTTIVDSGWTAVMLSDGTILMEADRHPAPTQTDTRHEFDDRRADPVTLEIFNQHFRSIADRMGTVLQKTSVSVNVKERLDFSCAIFTTDGDLVVNAPHIPVHLGAMSETVRQTISRNGSFQRGDVFVTNHPYAGGSHLPDVTVMSPVFANPADRQPSFWVASRAHHSEIGGVTPGSMPPDAKCLGEEGVLIDNFQLRVGDGELRLDALRDVLIRGRWPSRCPDENLSDVAAQVAANRTGEDDLLTLMENQGRERVLRYMQFIQDAAEQKTRSAIRRLPDGRRTFVDSMDTGATIRVAITVGGDEIVIDFTGTDPVQPDNLNANPAIVSSAIMYVMRLLIDEDIPLNEGVMRPVTIVLPSCFLNPPAADDPLLSPAIVGGNVETSQRVVDVLLGALEIAAASQGTMNNFIVGDSTFGYYETIGGGSGATADSAGADAVQVHMTNTRLTDPEIVETRYPMIVREFAIRQDSGGAGEHRGGDGMVREIELRVALTVSLLTNRRNCQPWGLAGGSSGMAGTNKLIRDGKTIELGSKCQLTVQPGDRLRIETPGGGGWGEAS